MTTSDAASITTYPDGPLIVRGAFQLFDVDGTEIDPGRRTVALCRCGRSALKPFCDGSHKLPLRVRRDPDAAVTVADTAAQPGQDC